MPHLFVFCLAAFFVLLFSQFRARLQALGALLCWMLPTVSLLAAAWPGSLQPVADFFGITLASNLIFGAIISFLSMMVAELRADHTAISRKLRYHIAEQTAEQASFSIPLRGRRLT